MDPVFIIVDVGFRSEIILPDGRPVAVSITTSS